VFDFLNPFRYKILGAAKREIIEAAERLTNGKPALAHWIGDVEAQFS
jgi:hypothetical protein